VSILTTAYELQEQLSYFKLKYQKKVIQEITGHRSVKALRQYEKVSDVQKKAACNILTGSTSKNYSDEIDRLKQDSGQTARSSACKDVVTSTADVGKSALPFQLGVFNPVINSNSSGTVNLILNLCPSGNETEIKQGMIGKVWTLLH